MNKQTKGITPLQIIFELNLMDEGYQKICTYKDGLGTNIVMAKGDQFVIISTNYLTLEPHCTTLNRQIVEKMFMYGKER